MTGCVACTSVWFKHSYKHWTGARRECVWLLLGHGLRSTEALRHICMFSHCCINYGWNTDGVLLNLCSAHTSTHVTCNTQNCRHFFFPAWKLGEGFGIFSVWKEGVGGECVIDPRKWDSSFDTHTVDSKQPWTNGNSGFFSHCVLFLWYERKHKL